MSDSRARRDLLLSCLRDPGPTHAQVECAELLLAADHPDAARMLYDVLFLRTGFSAARIAVQARIARRTRLWGKVDWANVDWANVEQANVEQAGAGAAPAAAPADPRTDLQRLLSLMPAAVPDWRGIPATQAPPPVAGPSPAPALMQSELAGVVRQLCDLLREPATGEADIAPLLDRLDRDVRQAAAFDAAANVGADLPTLAGGLAFDSLRHFLRETADLAYPPFGSPRLFLAAARLDDAGLGPFLANATGFATAVDADDLAPATIRTTLDPDAADRLQRRALLAALRPDGDGLADLIDRLADAGLMPALRALHARLAARPDIAGHLGLVRRLRDAALDNADFELALAAQRLVVGHRPQDSVEHLVLGKIAVGAGNRLAADAAFAASHRLDRDHWHARDCLDALRAGRSGGIAATGGFATPAARSLARLHRHAEEGAALAGIARRALLHLALDPADVRDQLDCAELLAACGIRQGARVLFDVTFLGGGFSPARRRAQYDIARRLGLWGNPPWPAEAHAPPGRAIPGLALAQLAGLVAAQRGRPAPLPAALAPATVAPAAAARAPATSDAPPAGLRDLCERLCGALRQPLEDDGAELAGLLAELRAEVLDRPPVDPDGYAGMDADTLAAAVAEQALRGFLAAIEPLAASFGTPALLHEAARLDEAGLAPYFARAYSLAGGPRDLLALIRLAAGPDRADERDLLERWAVLLSGRSSPEDLRDLVDELADLGLLRAVRAICARAAAGMTAGSDPGLMWAIRDAGLDRGDFGLAVAAQQAVAAARPENAVEWVVLGEVAATAGDPACAADAFARALALDPGNHGARERLAALRAGAFAPFRVTAGFGTSADRLRLRQRRRAAEPATA